MSKIRIVTHSSGFHADDVFAVASLKLLLGDEETEVIRTRDLETISTGDYIVDVGFIYDEAKNKFDHHQEGYAGARKNGIRYSSFGLVWKKFGAQISGSEEVAKSVDEHFVQSVDAFDNGIDLCLPTHETARALTLQSVVSVFKPGWKEEKSMDTAFLEAVDWAKIVIARAIIYNKTLIEMQEYAEEVYKKTDDKRLIVFGMDQKLDRDIIIGSLKNHQEPIYFVRYRPSDDNWAVECVRDDVKRFDTNRKRFPEKWAGKNKKDLVDITGVEDSYFCHNNRFICVAKSKEGALKLAQLALDA